MNLTKAARFILGTLMVAAAVHVGTLYGAPYVILWKVGKEVEKRTGVNTVLHAPPATADARAVVKPSPDLLYSVCAYDVSKGPVRLGSDVPQGTYWSMSLYAANTDNFAVLNDAQAQHGAVEAWLVQAGSGTRAPAGAQLIESPTKTGVVLFRSLVDDPRHFAAIDQARRTAHCEPAAAP